MSFAASKRTSLGDQRVIARRLWCDVVDNGTEQDFGANFEQEDGANADVRACFIHRMRTMTLLGTLKKTRSEIDSGI